MPIFKTPREAIGWCGFSLREVERLRLLEKDIEASHLLSEIEAAQDWIETQPVEKGYTTQVRTGWRKLKYEFD